MVEPIITRKLMRVGGSMAILVDPDFIKGNDLKEGQALYVVADKRIMFVTFDKEDATAVAEDIHGLNYWRLRQRAQKEKPEK